MTSSFQQVTINDTGSLTLPNGTTAQRPSAAVGQMRYNTSLNRTEYYDGSNWQSFVTPTVGYNMAVVTGSGNHQTHVNGAHRVHYFISGSNTFTPTMNGYVEVLTVGGGGGGGGTIGGGGGGGGVVYSSAFPVTAGTPYTVTVGKGGSGTKSTSQSGTTYNGSTSYFAGPNLLTNGNFDSNVSGWTVASAPEGTFTWDNSQAVLTNATVTDPPVCVYQAITCEVGKTYVVTGTKSAGEILAINIVTTVTAGGGSGGFGNVVYFSNTGDSGSQAATFVAAQTSYYVILRINTNAISTVTVDNVGVYEATTALVAYGGGGGNNNNGAGVSTSATQPIGSCGGNGEGSTVTVPTTGQGNRGGFAYDPSPYPSGGGGGAGGPGGDATLNTNKGGDGGPGQCYNITGVPVYYGAGGGGAAYIVGNNYYGGYGGVPFQRFTATEGVFNGQEFKSIYQGPGTGGSSYIVASNGLDGTGQGGGGGSAGGSANGYGADGGSGVVIVRYLSIDPGTVAQTYVDANYDTTWICPTGVTQVELLVVGGGGGGGAYGGGGGAGGVLYHSGYPVSAGSSYTVRVGRGGAGGVTTGNRGTSGGNSYFGSLQATGGGGGGGYSGNAIGLSGGSGGGSGYDASPSQYGSGVAGQGNNGGGSSSNNGPYPGGGGGGAGGVGATGTGIIAGNGGAGAPYIISGALKWYAAGGGGGLRTNSGGGFQPGFGGSGIGGSGAATATNLDGTAAAPNTGSGGGGGGAAGPEGRGGNGSDGIVIIRYKPA